MGKSWIYRQSLEAHLIYCATHPDGSSDDSAVATESPIKCVSRRVSQNNKVNVQLPGASAMSKTIKSRKSILFKL